jgi:hypothetical protein
MYFWRSYTATVSGSRTTREQCTGCSKVFEYRITREATGGGHSPFFLQNAVAEVSAKTLAQANLNRALAEAIEPVHCPARGIFQPDMVHVLCQRYGQQYQPNKHASKRIAVLVETAWRSACEANNVEAYTKFIEVWPTSIFSWRAERRIKELEYSPYLRKAISVFFWIGWGAAALFIVDFWVLGWRATR